MSDKIKRIIRGRYLLITKMKKIIIYTTSSCPFCEATKRFLQEKGYTYEERNVENNENYLKEMIDKSGQWGVPVIDIEGKIVVGFRPREIEAILNEE
jgi:glutaredoxin-like YruB-family protein